MKYFTLIILPFLVIGTCVDAQVVNDRQPVESAQSRTTDHSWTIGVSGGTAVIEQFSDQNFVGISVTKDLDESYVSASLSYIDSGNIPGLINNVPASTTEITVAAGTAVGALNFDGYLSFGRRHFDVEPLSRNGRSVNIKSGGDAFGLGLSASYDIILNESSFLTPIIGVDYNELDVGRVVLLPNGSQVALENKENGVTGNLGLAAQQLFGKENDHLLIVVANIVTTSNTTSFNPGNAQYPVLRALALNDTPGQKDSWGEIGGSLSIALNRRLRLDLSVLRTIGFLNSDATSLSTGLRYSF
ncbi:hypothetical protein MNBD_ALPHA04-1777 [hydrothermal vent metagenome]|uniref:Autotransporter domain-containing protein n=1 Tax=hydrothermal vent metagenome TaxID=652676 RepID=A0A3B0S0M3_9ZZZZ